jgi:hypothetical protein
MGVSRSSGWIERFLAADPKDVGCDEVIAVMHVWVDQQLAGLDPDERYPGVTEHLSACTSCNDDILGLALAAREHGWPAESA